MMFSEINDQGDKMLSWQGKVVLITGGSSGIGHATARKFLEQGACVVINGSDAGRLSAAVRELAAEGGRISGVCADIRKPDECAQLVRSTLATAGRLDLLVNSAGVWLEGDAELASEAMWDRVLDVNLKGTFFTSQQAIAALEQTRGAIINISSDAGVVGNKGAAIYSASKGGVNLLTKALALELAAKKIRVNAICPADVQTPMLEKQAATYGTGDSCAYLQKLLEKYPTGTERFIRPEEVAELVLFLVSPAAAAITGSCMSIDFGITAGY
jgi:NAD(P)-dependent dehydrogenase (short-subunit alcohol dehydrogenase family)